MVDITPRIAAGAMVIQSYAHGQFKVNNQVFATPIIVTPTQVLPWDGVNLNSGHAVEILQSMLARLPHPAEVLLIGAGASLPPVLPAWIRQARNLFGVSVDMMDTPAACRTYNVLLTEGRGVVAVLNPV